MSEEPVSIGSTETVKLEPHDPNRLIALCGPFDQNLRDVESRLGIHIKNRGHTFQLTGPEDQVKAGGALLSHLYVVTKNQSNLDRQTLHSYLQDAEIEKVMTDEHDGGSTDPRQTSALTIKTPKKHLSTRGRNQYEFIRRIRQNDINFAIGPAGTGKTYLAVASAVEALDSRKFAKILLVRPAVEVGEKLGFLPGDLAQKVNPYLRPLYDAMYEMLGFDRFEKLYERSVIEVAPLAYMRGRTLSDAFIILDEGQNTTIPQMKMFLTRIGFNSKVAITGDLTQIDLPDNARGQRSGLAHILDILPNLQGVSITRFNSSDVVRHRLVQQIVDAYAEDDKQRKRERAQSTTTNKVS